MNCSIHFNRFKKKNLTLIYMIYPKDLSEILSEIKYKKIFQCYLKEEQGSLFEEKTLNGHTIYYICLVKLSKTQIISGIYDKSINPLKYGIYFPEMFKNPLRFYYKSNYSQ